MSRSATLAAFGILLLLNGCIETPPPPIETKAEIQNEEVTWTAEEEELKAFVERFLTVAGNYDLAAMDAMISDKANLGISRMLDGVWQNKVISISEYFESAKSRELGPYYEPVDEWTIHINRDQIAFVIADATLHGHGVSRSRNIDYFTLIKEKDSWQFINLSFTVKRLDEELLTYHPEAFARSYAQAWSGVRPEFVASYFSEEGYLQINEGEPAAGRTAITAVAQGFMTDLPDMQVRYDSLVNTASATIFYWTLIGTNTGPGGTGKKVHVSGYEHWQLDENGLIKESKGTFPSEEYARQLEVGYEGAAP